jgi:hypothetical protein
MGQAEGESPGKDKHDNSQEWFHRDLSLYTRRAGKKLNMFRHDLHSFMGN